MRWSWVALLVVAGGLTGSGCRPWEKCGDGTVNPGEACDNGGKDDDTCTAQCTLPRCGDALRQSWEECDDGNDVDDDGCSTSCVLPRCGDGTVQRAGTDAGPGEECDDGNRVDTDGCTTACRTARCGDGILWIGHEECDDGNQEDGDGCSSQCKKPRCGDGHQDPGEECDDGNASDQDGCTGTCTAARCGDGLVNTAQEQCDEGPRNGSAPSACSSTCTLPSCGDGVVQAPEECDDGNADNTDSCLSSCRRARQGDGYVWAGHEQCDDGNLRDDDLCPNSGRPATCGDGRVLAGGEECDDGNQDDADGCRSNCTLPRCGDGLVQLRPTLAGRAPEECDDANLDNTDGCLVNCRRLDLCQAFHLTDVEPSVSCYPNQPTSLTLVSTGFLEVDGTAPEVAFNGAPVAVLDLLGCATVDGAYVRARRCTGLVMGLPAALAAGDYAIHVRNPITQTCEGDGVYSLALPPAVTNVTPSLVCEGAASFTITGTGFAAGSNVEFTSPNPEVGTQTPTSTQWNSSTQLLASFTAIPPGFYDVTVANGPACTATLPSAVHVLANPTIFFVDPQVAYNGISLQATLYVSGINGGNVSFVGIRPTGTEQEPLSLLFTYNPARPNQVLAVIPAGQVPGTYDVLLRDANNCQNVLRGFLRISGTLNLDLLAVDPPFGGTTQRTAVTLSANNPPVAPATDAFVSVPRVYLSPVGAGAGVLATALSAVSFTSAKEVSAVVPTGLAVGAYDVVVVNPDGGVGVLFAHRACGGPQDCRTDQQCLAGSCSPSKGFTVTQDPPPVIDDVTPGSVVAATPTPVAITGSGFLDNARVSTVCRLNGITTTTAATVSTVSPTAVTAEITSPAVGAVCVVRVDNPDGTYAEFSAVGTTNASFNLNQFAAQAAMNTPRRALVSVAARVTRTARYLYALGGDNGTVAGALDSIEAAPLDRFGSVVGFRTLVSHLPQPRTLAGAVVLGRFIYVLGGDQGSGPVKSVVRAQVLDPAEAPVINDVQLDLAGNGLTPGVWFYRVTAVKDGADPFNPDGETLPSDPQPVAVPEGLPKPLQVQLRWGAVPHAAHYRIYRTQDAGLAAGTEQLLEQVSGSQTSYADDGRPTTAGTAVRVLGELGTWVPLRDLNTPREGLGVGVAADPSVARKFYLYALSGKSGSNSVAGNYEILGITQNADGSHTLDADWTQPALSFTGRWQMGAFVATNRVTTRVSAGTTYIYLGGGYSDAAGTTAIRNVDVGLVATATGALGNNLMSVSQMTQTSPGYGFAAAANQLLTFGGSNSGSGTAGGSSTQICGPGANCGGGQTAPLLKNWNSGISLLQGRVLMGSAMESGQIFMLGGNDATGTPTASTEAVVW